MGILAGQWLWCYIIGIILCYMIVWYDIVIVSNVSAFGSLSVSGNILSTMFNCRSIVRYDIQCIIIGIWYLVLVDIGISMSLYQYQQLHVLIFTFGGIGIYVFGCIISSS